MFFRQRAAAHASLSYLFGCAGVGKAVAVDVLAGDEDWFIAEAALQPDAGTAARGLRRRAGRAAASEGARHG
jgi:hypothetical protein